MDYNILIDELNNDPLSRGYVTMSDGERLASLSTANRDINVETVTGQDIFEAVVPSEYAVLSVDFKSLLYAIMGMGTIYVNGTNTKVALLAMFGAGTTTRTNLAKLQVTKISRAVELGLGVLGLGHLQSARELMGV